MWLEAAAAATLAGSVLGLVGGALAALLARGLASGAPRRGVARLALALAVVGAVVDATVYVNLYPDAHALVGLATCCAATVFGVARLRGSWLRHVALVGVVGSMGAVALGRVPWPGHQAVYQAVVARTAVVGRVATALWPSALIDVDAGCSWPPPVPYMGVTAAPRASILLVTIDAFRGDHGGDALARHLPRTVARLADASRFDRAYAAAPRTTYSTYSLLTGKQPHHLGFVAATTDVNDNFVRLRDDDAIMLDPRKWKLRHRYPLGDGTPTLAGILGDAGWATIAIVSDVALLPGAGITREFTVIDDAPYQAVRRRDLGGETSETTTDSALARIGDVKSTQPWFAWLHYRDPHHPYTAFSPVEASASDLERYESELQRVDVALARLLRELDSQGRLTDTIVVITGDHGEEFRDHGGQFHGTTLYQELIHVPLVVRVPFHEGRVVQSPVSLTDVAPTLLDLVGVVAPQQVEGQSVAGLLTDERWTERPLFAYNTSYTAAGQLQVAVIEGSLKLIEDEGKGTVELFDLDTDPHERSNLVDALPDDVARLRCLAHGTGVFSADERAPNGRP